MKKLSILILIISLLIVSCENIDNSSKKEDLSNASQNVSDDASSNALQNHSISEENNKEVLNQEQVDVSSNALQNNSISEENNKEVLNQEQVDAIVKEAFKVWSSFYNIVPTRFTSRENLTIENMEFLYGWYCVKTDKSKLITITEDNIGDLPSKYMMGTFIRRSDFKIFVEKYFDVDFAKLEKDYPSYIKELDGFLIRPTGNYRILESKLVSYKYENEKIEMEINYKDYDDGYDETFTLTLIIEDDSFIFDAFI